MRKLGHVSAIMFGMGMGMLFFAAVIYFTTPAHPREGGQWDESDLERRQWFSRQMMPDNPPVRCCGEADAYYADKFEVSGDTFYAVITDDRDDAPLNRPHIAPGTRIEIPAHKFNDPRKDPNPTGHGIVFVTTSLQVLCYFNMPGDG